MGKSRVLVLLEKLYAEAVAEGLRNHARARLRQINAAQEGATLAQLAEIWRREFAYTPEDRADDEKANGSY